MVRRIEKKLEIAIIENRYKEILDNLIDSLDKKSLHWPVVLDSHTLSMS